jgi:proline dehydrogenase
MNLEDSSFDTSPPDETHGEPALRRFKSKAVSKVSALMLPIMRRAARSYVGGDTVQDALFIARRLAEDSLPNTLGFWDTTDYSAQQVMDTYLESVDALAASGLDSYLSIKPPALRFDAKLATQLATVAKARGVRIHCDSHGPEVADSSHEMEQGMLARLGAENLSTTLPGRWLRSLPDADWAVERGIRARVVKGQWADPAAPDRDMRDGYFEVIERLAGRARHVGVATHDVPLAAKSIERLRAAGTPYELELLYGMPMTEALAWAKENSAPVRVYVPYGRGFIPSALGVLKRNPHLAWLMLKDLFARTTGE